MADQDNSLVRFLSGCENLNTDGLKSSMCKTDYHFAQKNAKNISFIGSMDYFDIGIKNLANHLGWSSIPDYGKDNSYPDHRNNKDLEEHERLLIAKTQKFDILLITEFAKKIIKK